MSKYSDPEIEEDSYNESEDDDYVPNKQSNEVKPTSNEESDDSEDDAELKNLDATYAEFQGRGGLIKTRAQRRAEAAGLLKPDESSKPAPIVGESSVDIDALWQEMNASAPASKTSKSSSPNQEPSSDKNKNTESGKPSVINTKHAEKVVAKAQTPDADKASSTKTAETQLEDEYITITRTYKFAGSVKTETKQVLKNSAEGQDYLKQEKLKQELRSQRRAPAKRKMSLMEEYKMNKTKKINTLEKSRSDWLGFVDKEGIKEDLTKFNKAGYLDKQDFLSRVDTKRDSDLRQQRAKKM